MKKIRSATILSGCGVFDGTETFELSALIFSLHKYNILNDNFSLNIIKNTKINYLKRDQDINNPNINILEESARLVRGNIKNINELDVNNYDMLVIPGGFGVAKNLSNFAFKQEHFEVEKEFEDKIKEFKKLNKIIISTCISPLILSKILGNITITLGGTGSTDIWPYQGTIEIAKNFGATVKESDISDVIIDKENKLLSTCCFMKNIENYNLIYESCNKLIEESIKLI